MRGGVFLHRVHGYVSTLVSKFPQTKQEAEDRGEKVRENLQECSSRKQQQHPRPPHPPLPLHMLAPQNPNQNPRRQRPKRRREAKNNQMSPRGPLAQPLLEQHTRKPKRRGRFMHHNRDKYNKAQLRVVGASAGAHGDAVCRGVDHEAGSCG